MLDLSTGEPYGPEALPYGSFSTGGGPRRIGVRIADRVLDLTGLAARLHRPYADLVRGPVLNPLMAAGPAVWAQVRADVTDVLRGELSGSTPDSPPSPDLMPGLSLDLTPIAEVELHLPFEVADYVDFYSSEHHARNVGQIFRPGQSPLTPNWKHLPIGYHGRAGTVVVSGTPIVRPAGQRKDPEARLPDFGPSQRLDIEAEVGFVVGVPSAHGTPVAGRDLPRHVFGVVLLNDWSARDLQAWEAVPLGPFLGKSFATTISAWVLPLAALAPARIASPPRDEPLLAYLADEEPWGLDLDLTVTLNGEIISRPPFSAMYWNAAQQLAHMTVNGASLRTGDLFGSGTVSGPAREQYGSLLELSWGGRDTIQVGQTTRTFLEDGDEVVITATAPGNNGTRIALGEVRGRVEPATTRPVDP
jgi:fumarylacetoacetase